MKALPWFYNGGKGESTYAGSPPVFSCAEAVEKPEGRAAAETTEASHLCASIEQSGVPELAFQAHLLYHCA